MRKKTLSIISLMLCFCFLAAGCGNTSTTTGTDNSTSDTAGIEKGEDTMGEAVTAFGKIDNKAWQYNSDDDVYYQIGISYCEKPADTNYETLAVFVPGSYMNATDNGDGTYTCEINSSAKVGNYTADTAPIVMPINTPGYSAMRH